MEHNQKEERREESRGGVGGGSFGSDYGGMGDRLDEVDLDAAEDVGSDPPGGLGTDIGGGTNGIGRDNPERGDLIGG